MKWLDRTLVISPYHIGLCISEKQFYKEIKRLKLPKGDNPIFMPSPTANACVHFLENSEGRAAIVCFGAAKGKSKKQIYSLLLHEAVHIWQAIVDHIDGGKPCDEFEAYSIQSIAQKLFYSYDEQTKKAKRK